MREPSRLIRRGEVNLLRELQAGKDRIATLEQQLSAEEESGLSFWRCFHCGFQTSSMATAAAHFGDRDDAEEFKPVCSWWRRMSPDDRGQALQDVIQQLNDVQAEATKLATTNAGLQADLTGRLRQISGKDSRITELEQSELKLQAANAGLVAKCTCACCDRKDHFLAHNRDTALSCSCADYPESERCDCYYCTLVARVGELERALPSVEILKIMQTYREQEASPGGVGTPGGLEHMGDVWALFKKWERAIISAAKGEKP